MSESAIFLPESSFLMCLAKASGLASMSLRRWRSFRSCSAVRGLPLLKRSLATAPSRLSMTSRDPVALRIDDVHAITEVRAFVVECFKLAGDGVDNPGTRRHGKHGWNRLVAGCGCRLGRADIRGSRVERMAVAKPVAETTANSR
jgi:hypothetical protein